MLKNLNKTDFDNYIDFAYSLALDQSKSVYPTYTDGIKTKEDFVVRAKKAFARENEEILLFEVGGAVEGWIHYYALEDDACISFCAFNINQYTEVAIDEFVKYASTKYKGYTLQFGLPTANVNTISCLEKKKFGKADECNVDVLHFKNYQLLEVAADITEVTKENFSEFANLHAIHDEDMYWNNERIWEKLDEWHIYLCYISGEVAGAIYYTYFDIMMEIFGVDYGNNQFDETVFKGLLVKALNEGKKDGVSNLIFFNAEEEHATVAGLGFEHVGEYVLYERKI